MKDAKARKDISPAPGYDTRLWQRMAYETAAIAQRNPWERDHYSKVVFVALSQRMLILPALLDLATAPSYRRRGLASILVKWGIERADENRKTIILDASPSGFPLYKTLGFKEVDKLEIPLEEYGGEGVHVHGNVLDPSKHMKILSDNRLVHMIRKPKV
jgi:ribosomal protein S18 acetylase RimI-like enzyme